MASSHNSAHLPLSFNISSTKMGRPASLSQRPHGKTNVSETAEGFRNILDAGADCTPSSISNHGLPRAFKPVNKRRINDLSLCQFVIHDLRHRSRRAAPVLHDFLSSMDGHCKNLSQLVISQQLRSLLFSSYCNQVPLCAVFH